MKHSTGTNRQEILEKKEKEGKSVSKMRRRLKTDREEHLSHDYPSGGTKERKGGSSPGS